MKDKSEVTTYLRAEKVYFGELPFFEDNSSLVIVAGEKPCKDSKQPKLPKSQTDMLALLDEHESLTYTEWWKLYEAQDGKKRTFDYALVLQRDFFWSILKGSFFLEVKCHVNAA